MDLIRTIHGEMRWLIVIVAVIVVVKFAIGWLGSRQYQSIDRTLLLIYSTLLDINFLLGLILLFTLGISGAARLEHAITMFLAVAAAHMTAIWRNADDSAVKYRNQLLVVLVSLLLVLVGVIRLRGVLYAEGFF